MLILILGSVQLHKYQIYIVFMLAQTPFFYFFFPIFMLSHSESHNFFSFSVDGEGLFFVGLI